MTDKALEIVDGIVLGVSYLAAEAEKNSLNRIGNILRICSRDLGIAAQNLSTKESCKADDLLSVIQLLYRLSATKDAQAKNAFLSALAGRETDDEQGDCDACQP